jgi:hypothetical protein
MQEEVDLDTVMQTVNDHLLSEIGRVALTEAHRRAADGQSSETIVRELNAMLPDWNAWRVRAYRSLREQFAAQIERWNSTVH